MGEKTAEYVPGLYLSRSDQPLVPPVIEAKRVCFAFGSGDLKKQILFDIDLQIYPGEVVLLTGPSGSGKTTLLTLIAALRSMQSGELTVLGVPLHEAAAAELVTVRRSIGFIFQQHNLLGFLSARKNVELMFQLHPEISAREAVERSCEILKEVGLGDRLDYFPANLSGGQKQRVAIARALVCRPQLILADEPTAALDGTSGRDVVNLLVKLARETGCPVLMVTHDSRVLDIADRIVSFEDGRIVAPS
jgi:putative ABC transport system ATP-binding protein